MHMHQLIQTRDSMTQPERLISILLPENMEIDSRGLEDLLSFLHQLAGQIIYYDADDRPAGDWAAFLESDPSVLIAILSKLDISGIVKQYDRIDFQIGKARTEKETDDLLRQLDDLFDELKNKVQVFRENFGQRPVRSSITVELSTVLDSYMQSLDEIRSLTGPTRSENTTYKDTPDPSGSQALAQIDSLFSAIKAKHAYLQSTAGDYLQTHPILDQDHSPHIGLLLTFLHLYSHLQVDLNGLTRKHLDLYYRQILNIEPLPAVADEVLICFEPDPSMKTIYRLPAGTELLAALAGSQRTMVYRTTEDLLLAKTRVADLRTIYVSNDPIMTRRRGVGQACEARVYQGSYFSPAPKDLLKEGAVIDTWPILGEDQLDMPERNRTMKDADLGILIGAPVLYLPEGERSIRLEFIFTKESFTSFHTFMQSFSQGANPGKEAEGKPIELVYIELLSNAFVIDYTAPDGWETINKYSFRPGRQANSLEISFDLDHTRKPMQSYKKEIHKSLFAAAIPIIRVLINNNSSHTAYSYLKDLVIERVNIRSSVREFRTMKLQNNTGVLSAANPFQIFGPQPSIGSYLDIKNTNIFNRYTTDFSFRMEWLNLPNDPHGFEDYYAGYGAGITNGSFRVRMGSITGGRYDVQDGPSQEFALFKTEDGGSSGALSDSVRMTGIDMKRFEFTGEPLLEKEDAVSNTVFKEGAVRIELIAPDEAFGHRIFPQIFTRAAQEKKKVLPNQPYIPMVKSISVDYTLEYSAVLQSNTAARSTCGHALMMIHQHPFGYDELFPENDQYAYPFLPQFGGRNNLYIGLKDAVADKELSLLFHLEEKKFHHSSRPHEKVSWSFLQDNRWIGIDGKDILSDSTNSFINSGIVKIILPDNFQKGNTILDPDLYWLRASAKIRKSSLAKVIAIYAHGSTAKRVMEPGENDSVAFRLPAGSIKDLRKRVPVVATVWQLFPSFNGRPAETDNDYYIRVSERLRHKHRPLTTRDIEQFILKEFPDIFLVKCFGMGSGTGLILPGVNVQLIVIPKEQENGLFTSDEPQVNLAALYRIKNWLVKVLSPFVHIEVGNPVYEKVKIACSVQFTSTGTGDQGLLPARLHLDIKRYLCPWLFEEGSDIIIGGKIYLSDILNFIKHLPYVEYVTGFSVVHFFRIQDINTGGYTASAIDSARRPVKFICGSIPGAVLVPCKEHLITILDKPGYVEPGPMGIGHFAVGSELFQAKDKASLDRQDPDTQDQGSQDADPAPIKEHSPESGATGEPEETFDLFINHHIK